jgi:hypothetical protein
MKVRVSEGDYPEIELSGTGVEWSALAQAVRHDGLVVPCESDADPRPYARFGDQIVVAHTPNRKVRFAISEVGVEITGDPVHLETLSRVMSTLSGPLPPGYHVHVDYQGDDHFVASDSVPVILLYVSQ